jgi:phosphatidylglycerophosphatase A|tara:strand:+ start:1081 stop:1575 length:495 start_codon:yes stop_codon:yes gene_type:complete
LIILTNNPTYAQLLKSPVLLLAFGFGSGLSPKAPGTVGSLLGLGLWLFLAQLSLPFYLVFVAICAVAGVYICGVAADRLGVHDHGGIVWDEFVGLWIAMTALPVSWASIILGFGLFRLFDIFKPWPISWMDKNISGGLGIMLDDIAAGVATAVSIGLLHLLGWI